MCRIKQSKENNWRTSHTDVEFVLAQLSWKCFAADIAVQCVFGILNVTESGASRLFRLPRHFYCNESSVYNENYC